METNVAQEPGQIQCPTCKRPVWRAHHGGTVRMVELAETTSNGYGGSRFKRYAGHVALTFPLVDGEPILATVTRGLTRYRFHVDAAFSAAAFRGKRNRARAGGQS